MDDAYLVIKNKDYEINHQQIKEQIDKNPKKNFNQISSIVSIDELIQTNSFELYQDEIIYHSNYFSKEKISIKQPFSFQLFSLQLLIAIISVQYFYVPYFFIFTKSNQRRAYYSYRLLASDMIMVPPYNTG